MGPEMTCMIAFFYTAVEARATGSLLSTFDGSRFAAALSGNAPHLAQFRPRVA
jgi:hypothetical protein